MNPDTFSHKKHFFSFLTVVALFLEIGRWEKMLKCVRKLTSQRNGDNFSENALLSLPNSKKKKKEFELKFSIRF